MRCSHACLCSASSGLALDFRPIARALRYDTFFEALAFHKLNRRDAVSEMVSVLQTNCTLRALRMTGCEYSSGIENIGAFMAQNAGCRVVSLDLSGTPLSNVALAAALTKMNSIEALLLSGCSLGDRCAPGGLVVWLLLLTQFVVQRSGGAVARAADGHSAPPGSVTQSI